MPSSLCLCSTSASRSKASRLSFKSFSSRSLVTSRWEMSVFSLLSWMLSLLMLCSISEISRSRLVSAPSRTCQRVKFKSWHKTAPKMTLVKRNRHTSTETNETRGNTHLLLSWAAGTNLQAAARQSKRAMLGVKALLNRNLGRIGLIYLQLKGINGIETRRIVRDEQRAPCRRWPQARSRC